MHLKRTQRAGLPFAVLASVCGFAHGTQNNPHATSAHRLIVQLQPGVRISSASPTHATLTCDTRGLRRTLPIRNARPALQVEPQNPSLARSLGLDRFVVIDVPAGEDPNALTTAISAHSEWIASAEYASVVRPGQSAPTGAAASGSTEYDGLSEIVPNPIPTNDPDLLLQWGLLNTGQVIQGQQGVPGADTACPAAWSIETGSESVVVAVIDAGVDMSHPDLQGKLTQGINLSGDGPGDDPNDEVLGHGTHAAGVIGADSDNGIGIAGVAQRCEIMPIKILNRFGFGSETEAANGLIWAADNGADVANMSIGFSTGSIFFRQAVNYAYAEDVVIVASSGNNPIGEVLFPARWTKVIAVSATDNRDQLATFSTIGPQIDVSAPGVDIWSTYTTPSIDEGYGFLSGTSMAAPYVAGLAALIRSVNPSLTAETVRDIIELTAVDLGRPGRDHEFGFGRIDAATAVAFAELLNDSSDTTCLGDFNGDGSADFLDISAFLDAFATNDLSADLDRNGELDFFDIAEFLSRFNACFN